MTDNNELREYAKRLFADPDHTADAPSPTQTTPRVGPVIPNQEQSADMKQRRTPEQIWVNKLLNSGTIREHY